jgi:hypothetical protein
MTITEFLLARIEEDEKQAHNVLVFRMNPRTNMPGNQAITARVLAECAAKRAIIKQHEDWPVLVERSPTGGLEADDIQSMTFRMVKEIAWLTEREYVKRFGAEPPTTPMIKALAAVYASHADYRQEWAL